MHVPCELESRGKRALTFYFYAEQEKNWWKDSRFAWNEANSPEIIVKRSGRISTISFPFYSLFVLLTRTPQQWMLLPRSSSSSSLLLPPLLPYCIWIYCVRAYVHYTVLRCVYTGRMHRYEPCHTSVWKILNQIRKGGIATTIAKGANELCNKVKSVVKISGNHDRETALLMLYSERAWNVYFTNHIIVCIAFNSIEINVWDFSAF